MCHDHLGKLAGEGGTAGPSAAEAVQLASVTGACGDCCQQLGMPEAAAGHYAASTDHLVSCSERSPEVSLSSNPCEAVSACILCRLGLEHCRIASSE